MKADISFDPARAAKTLLREARSGALATLTPGSLDPYASLANVATDADGAPILLLSRLALHTKNLLADSRASLMLDERKDGDPLEGARVTLSGPIEAHASERARARYLMRHPDAEAFAGFGDFTFYRMEITRTHLIAGFGRIVDLPPADILTDISNAGALLEAEAGATAHMNEDHADALRLYATRLLGASDGDWRCVGCDPEGLDLQLGRVGRRLMFPEPVVTPGALRQVLVRLAEQARAV